MAITTTTTTKAPQSRRMSALSKVLLAGAVVAGGVIAVQHFAPGSKAQNVVPSVPPKAVLPTGPATGSAPAAAVGDKAGCTNLPEVRMLLWAWNAQQGLLHANGGAQATAGSLMCKHGVNLKVERQDDVGQMQAELVKCASELGKGKDDCASGAHYVAIMGDGSASFFAALQPQIAKVCPACSAEVIGSAGYSRGEDKLLGLPAWKRDPSAAQGALIAGYLRDGDWNIAMKWAGDNNICNNPDETTYDPTCLNWVAASDYIDAGAKYVQNYCEDRPVVSNGTKTGEKAHVCVNGVVTWTPGDVNVAKGRGGLVSIASTKEYVYQMPNVVIGLRKWDRANRKTVVGFLGAMTEGGDQVKQSPEARQRAAEISAVVYKEKDAAYWTKYFDVVTEKDATGLEVELGGSSVNNLADNLHLFGLADKGGLDRSIFAATYTVFGNIVVHYYPTLVPSIPRVGEVVDTSYLADLAAKASLAATTTAAADIPKYTAPAPGKVEREEDKEVIGRKNWEINFETAKDSFTKDADRVLEELYAQTVVTHTIVEINGHTDSDGDAEANRELSRRRALAVRDYLVKRAPVSFPQARFRVMGFGEDAPLVANDTPVHKAQNRRVEIVMRSK